MFINTIANYPTDGAYQTAYNCMHDFLRGPQDENVERVLGFYMDAYPKLYAKACEALYCEYYDI